MLVDEDDDEPPTVATTPAPATNPDEILLDDDEDDELAGQGIVSEEKGCKEGCGHAHEETKEATVNPDEIDVEMDDDEDDEEVSASLLGRKEEKGKGKDVEMAPAAEVKAPEEKSTRFLALSKPAFGKDFMQVRAVLYSDRAFTHS